MTACGFYRRRGGVWDRICPLKVAYGLFPDSPVVIVTILIVGFVFETESYRRKETMVKTTFFEEIIKPHLFVW